METAQTFVAWCPHHGIPLHEANTADGWSWCDKCKKLYRIIIKDGKVTVIEDNGRTYKQSSILGWYRGIVYMAKMHANIKRGEIDPVKESA